MGKHAQIVLLLTPLMGCLGPPARENPDFWEFPRTSREVEPPSPYHQVKGAILMDLRVWRELDKNLADAVLTPPELDLAQDPPRCTRHDVGVVTYDFTRTPPNGPGVLEKAYYCPIGNDYVYRHTGRVPPKDLWLGPYPLDRREVPDESFFPIVPGAEWTYVMNGEKEPSSTLRIAGRCTVSMFDPNAEDFFRDLDTWVLEGYHRKPVHLVPFDSGTRLLAERHVGYSGMRTFVPCGEFRWGSAGEWNYWTMSGCLRGMRVARREVAERVEVPAGTFTCLRIEQGDDLRSTVWLARGVGIVKLERVRWGGKGKPACKDVWELARTTGLSRD